MMFQGGEAATHRDRGARRGPGPPFFASPSTFGEDGVCRGGEQ